MSFWQSRLLAGFLALMAAKSLHSAAVVEVGGEVHEAVVVYATASLAAARTLTTRIGEITGTTPPLLRETQTPPAGSIVFHVGRTSWVEASLPALDTLHPYGYYLKWGDANRLILAGRTTQGTTYAVDDFLKRFGGYRHFMPGPLGEVIPQCATLTIPATLDSLEEPTFKSYYNAGMSGGRGAFARSGRPLMYATHWFYHIFNQEIYAADHPEYYPMINGVRFVPPAGMSGTWQPCVSNPDLPAIARDFARDYFAANPDRFTVPMGVNDGLGDCQCPDCLALKQAYGNQYIPFYNAVASLVRQEFPDKLVGFIAYGGAKEPPHDIQLDPGLHVEVTNGARDDLAILEQWQAAGATSLAIYDYLYGSGYVVPRHYPHIMAAAWRRGHYDLNVQGGWFETFTRVWLYDGPRQYVLNELAWNIEQDVDELLDDYFTSFYGAAATPIANLFALHEEVYGRRSDPLHPMADRDKPLQMADYTRDDLALMRHCFTDAEAALAADAAGKPAARLALLRQIHGLSELMIELEVLIRELAAIKSLNIPGASTLVATKLRQGFGLLHAIENYAMTPDAEEAIFTGTTLQDYRAQPLLQAGPRLETEADRLLTLLVAQLEQSDGWSAAHAFCLDLAESAVSPLFRGVALTPIYLKQQPQPLYDILINGECEPNATLAATLRQLQPTTPLPWADYRLNGWSTWHFQQTVTEFLLDPTIARSGSTSLAIGINNYSGSFMQSCSLAPGHRYRLTLRYRRTHPQRRGSASLRWQGKSGWLDVSGKAPRVTLDYSSDLATADAWQIATASFTAPTDALYPDNNVTALLLLSAASGQVAGEQINFDDISLVEIYDPATSLSNDPATPLRVRVVPPSTPHHTATAPYDTWDNAATNIALAVGYAESKGISEVVVSNGYYLLDGTVVINRGLQLRSFGNGTIDTANTVIDGAGLYRGFHLKHAAATIDGFTITNCLLQDKNDYGIAVWLAKGGTIRNCYFAGNRQTNSYTLRGGAVCMSGGLVVNSRFFNNQAGFGGGINMGHGAPNPVVSNCWFEANTASYGAGICQTSGDALVVDCTFTNNYALESSGGYGSYIFGSATLTALVDRCTFSDNAATNRNPSAGYVARGGGGIRIEPRSWVTVRNSLFTYNRADECYGGGILLYRCTNSMVENCTIVANYAGSSGGGIGVSTYSSYSYDGVTVCNCIIDGNWYKGSANHSNIVDNAATKLVAWSNNCTTTKLDLNHYGADNLLNIAPGFIAPHKNNWRLAKESLCVDAGQTLPWMKTARDLDGRHRMRDTAIDIGCYETVLDHGTILSVR